MAREVQSVPEVAEEGRRFVLTVSGSDGSGCAGMQAENRAIVAAGGFPLNVVTAVTVQTPAGFGAVERMAPDFVAGQMRALLDAYPVAAVKSGMLCDRAVVEGMAAVLDSYPDIPYVLDPVLRATGGRRLLEADAVAPLRELLMPRAALTTPNLDELAVLSGYDLPDESAVLEAAERLARRSGGPILVKGGHSAGAVCEDWLVDGRGGRRSYGADRVRTRNTRGTGCVLGAWIAARLAAGDEVAAAVGSAKAALTDALCRGAEAAWPGPGPGPSFVR